ncbi:hypothetical protein HK103_002507 [Boothiomyces macroporosus]|uniref:Alpha/beta hydrolase fold-3 domain-containing protein n=1 Tax=Boothiomyces macroporosus TaxID=261099 RepID=A0AAD5UM93_9FUNG|nr:hypothetical protein HK103_002507 [Boothiomyces macroporosus]
MAKIEQAFDYSSIPYHKRYDYEYKPPTPLKRAGMVSALFIPPIVKSSARYFTLGPKLKDWTLGYHVALLHVMGKMDNVKEIQTSTARPSALPKDAFYVEEYFSRSSNVVEFLKQRAPGEWPDVADEIQEKVYGEWIYRQEDTDPEMYPFIHKQRKPFDKVLLLIHGGAFVLGSAPMYRRNAYDYTQNTDAAAFTISYRLAPQNPYPCPLIDCVSAYIHLLEKFDASKIILMGDSAGGSLVLSTILVLRDMGIKVPAGAVCLSPWVDLTHSFPSFQANHGIDYLPDMPKDPRLLDRKHFYAANEFLDLPYVSPIWATDFSNFPPFLIQVGTAEKLHDEVVAFAKKVSKDSGNKVVLETYESHVHTFQILKFAQGAKAAISRIAKWIMDSPKTSEYKLYDFNGSYLKDGSHNI